MNHRLTILKLTNSLSF